MTGQSLLDRMELLNQELQLQAGESNVTRGLVALNVAQDYFESAAAQRPNIFGSSTGTVVTANGVETTSFPSGVLRIDRLQRLNASTSLPDLDLTRIHRVGGHASARYWPYNLLTSATTGAPAGYWTNGTSIYWQPLPSGVVTVRWYGFQSATDITASGTFLYPDMVALPIAAFAVALYKGGLDDDPSALGTLATTTFDGVLDTLGNFNRDGAKAPEYTSVHDA